VTLGDNASPIRADVELLIFQGCPHAECARTNLRAALEKAGAPATWKEWDLAADATPQQYRRYGSPTVLVNGADVTGDWGTAAAMACRTDGAPSVEEIFRRLT
jgi:hypothetical protein